MGSRMNDYNNCLPQRRRLFSRPPPQITLTRLTLILLVLLSWTLNTRAAQDIDWTQIEGKTIKVFYPGVASWEFVRGDDHGTGAAPVRTFKKAG